MILILLVLLFAIATSQTDQQSLCSRWENMYESMCPSQLERSALITQQGLPGKRRAIEAKGERRLKGSRGTKGSAGEAEYDRVEEMISQTMAEVIRVQSLKFSELSDALMDAKREISRLTNETGYCPIKYNGRCFWVAVRFSPEITFEQGTQMCEALGGEPANIYSEEHFNMTMEYLRTFTIKDYWTHAWLGMTYDKQTNTVLLSDGSRAPFVKWYPKYPDNHYCCNIFLLARMKWNNTYQYMVTARPSAGTILRGVFCEK